MLSIIETYNRPCSQPAEKQVTADQSSYALERDPDVTELLHLLEKHNAELLVNFGGRELGARYPEELTVENRPDRLRVNDLIYRSETVPDLLVLLPSGRWNHVKIRLFLGLSVPAARARGGREGKAN